MDYPDGREIASGMEEDPITRHIFKKTLGAADGAGEEFEVHMITLLFLRLLNAGADFCIASNVTAAGLFDDIVLRYRITPKSPWRAALVQLKHKNNSKLPFNSFLSVGKNADFGLAKYSKSYGEIKSRAADDEELKMLGEFEDFKFVIFTNARFGKLVDYVGGDKKLEGDSAVDDTQLAGLILKELTELAAQLGELREKVAGLSDPDALTELFKEGMESMKPFQSKEAILYTKMLGEKPKVEKLDELLADLELRSLIDTGGKCISLGQLADLKTDLDQLADLKTALAKLIITAQASLENHRDKEDEIIKTGIRGLDIFHNSSVNLFTESIMKLPQATIENLTKTVSTIENLTRTLSTMPDLGNEFLVKLKVFTKQAHQQHLVDLIKKELRKAWKTGALEADVNEIVRKVISWWSDKRSTPLTRESTFWLEIIGQQITKLSKDIDAESTVSFEFHEDHLHYLSYVLPSKGIFNLQVDSSTTVSAIKVMQALRRKFGDREMILHIDFADLLSRPDEIFAAWTSRWCNVLVVDCHSCPDRRISADVGAAITDAAAGKDSVKLFVLIASRDHALAKLLKDSTKEHKDNCSWENLARETQAEFCSLQIQFQGKPILLAGLRDLDETFTDRMNLETMSQLVQRNVQCGKAIEENCEFFVPRRLKRQDGRVNSTYALRDDVVLIVAEPGMGKTTLIRHLAATAKDEDRYSWVVHLRLNDCARLLREIGSAKLSPAETKGILAECALTPGNDLERSLLASLAHKLRVFIDGVDEVCPHYEAKIMTLLSGLRALKVSKLFVASRPVMQQTLERVLGVSALALEHFTRDDQESFFVEAWKRKLPDISHDKARIFTESLLTLVKSTLNEDNPILGVPLMAVLVAEAYEGRLLGFVNDGVELETDVKIDVLALYEVFVEKKFNIYMDDKKKSLNRDLSAAQDVEEDLRVNFLRNHRHASLRVIFGDVTALKIDPNENFNRRQIKFLEKIKNGKEKVGIIDNVTENVPHFVHKTFAEYFAACWLAENYKNNAAIVERVMFGRSFENVSEMFNRLLARRTENGTLEIHNAILNRDKKKLRRLLDSTTSLDDLDAGGRSPLHLAVYLGGVERHRDYVAIARRLLHRECRTDLADSLFGWRPLNYAHRLNAWTVAGLILANGGDVADVPSIRSIRGETRVKFVDFITSVETEPGLARPGSGLLLAAARDAGVDAVRYLVEERGGDVDCRGPLGEAMAHAAAEGGDVRLLGYLVAEGHVLDVVDGGNSTPFHYAARAGRVAAMRELVAAGLDVNAVNDSGETPLLLAVRRGTDLDVLEELARLSDINDLNRKCYSPRQTSPLLGNYRVISSILFSFSCLLISGVFFNSIKLHGPPIG